LDPDPGNSAQARAVREIAGRLAARWDGVPADRLPRRLDPLPAEITVAESESLRAAARPGGPLMITPVVGGNRLAPVDVDLAECDGTFVIAGPPRSGRSTALATAVGSLPDQCRVIAVAPRPSPLRGLPATVVTSAADLPAVLAA